MHSAYTPRPATSTRGDGSCRTAHTHDMHSTHTPRPAVDPRRRVMPHGTLHTCTTCTAHNTKHTCTTCTTQNTTQPAIEPRRLASPNIDSTTRRRPAATGRATRHTCTTCTAHNTRHTCTTCTAQATTQPAVDPRRLASPNIDSTTRRRPAATGQVTHGAYARHARQSMRMYRTRQRGGTRTEAAARVRCRSHHGQARARARAGPHHLAQHARHMASGMG